MGLDGEPAGDRDLGTEESLDLITHLRMEPGPRLRGTPWVLEGPGPPSDGEEALFMVESGQNR